MKNEKLLPSKEITIETTTHCGANCIICPRAKYRYKPEHMDMDLFKKVLDEAVRLGARSLDTCGFGDLFMDPRAEERLQYAKTKYPFLKIFVSTTCHMVNEKNIKLLKYVDTLKISMYGMTKATYEKVHKGALQHEKVLSNIEKIVSLPGNIRPYIIALFVVIPENKPEIEAWKRFWKSRADETMIWLPHNYGGAVFSAEGPSPKKKTCGRPFKGNPYVHADGKVSVCCFDFNKDLLIGDLTKEPLKDVLTGELLGRIREVHKDKTFDESCYRCRFCDQTSDRSFALVESSNKKRKVGVITSHPDLINDVGRYGARE